MKRKQMKDYARPGSNRAFRLREQETAHGRLQARFQRAVEDFFRRKERGPNPRGLKRWFVPGTMFEGKGVLTPYAAKERRRRRRARRIAHESRRRNRLAS